MVRIERAKDSLVNVHSTPSNGTVAPGVLASEVSFRSGLLRLGIRTGSTHLRRIITDGPSNRDTGVPGGSFWIDVRHTRQREDHIQRCVSLCRCARLLAHPDFSRDIFSQIVIMRSKTLG